MDADSLELSQFSGANTTPAGAVRYEPGDLQATLARVSITRFLGAPLGRVDLGARGTASALYHRPSQSRGVAWRLLRPGGAFLLHGITESPASKAGGGPSFVDRYIFPDSALPGIGELLQAGEDCGFEVRDVESLREHYVLTLRHWKKRLEANREQAVRSATKGAYELWRLFMAGAAYRFRIGHYNLYQTLLVKPDNGASGLPITRNDWYA
jgi:hypothetical protein